jgi:hypothetical protein
MRFHHSIKTYLREHAWGGGGGCHLDRRWEKRAAYASRMKDGGWLQFDMPFSIPLLNTVSGTEKAW